ncbi:MAG TPA: tyrosine-type recombinase/integrase [Xanthomonadaceae bacterium]|nr:tyrosine-type recombinase/integrase [Xanthomonadaceae bacterium]
MKGKLHAVGLRDLAPGKHFDAGGLYLHVMPTGSRLWRMKYRHGGKERLLAFGVFPEVTLAEARKRRDATRTLLRDGIDPAAERRRAKMDAAHAGKNTFGAVAREWLERQRPVLAFVTLTKAEWLLGMASALDHRPIGEIEPPELLAVLRQIESKGHHETAHRLKQRLGQVFRYAIATGRADRDPAADLRGALTPVKTTSRAALTDPAKVGELLRAIESFQGQYTTKQALRLAPLVFVRPGELRAAEWAEINLKAAEWRIPAARMKMAEEHVIPLSAQAERILVDLFAFTGRGRFLFPSLRTPARPMSENTVNAALRRLGFGKDEMTGHGFRALASTRLNELGWQSDVIERQLAHAPRNKVRAAYNRAAYMDERRKMMQSWADYLDSLRDGASVVAIRSNHR